MIIAEATQIFAAPTDSSWVLLIRNRDGTLATIHGVADGPVKVLGYGSSLAVAIHHFLETCQKLGADLDQIEYRGHWFQGLGPHLN